MQVDILILKEFFPRKLEYDQAWLSLRDGYNQPNHAWVPYDGVAWIYDALKHNWVIENNETFLLQIFFFKIFVGRKDFTK